MSIIPKFYLDIDKALDRLEYLYYSSINTLYTAIQKFFKKGIVPNKQVRNLGLFSYPELRVHWNGMIHKYHKHHAYGYLNYPGIYVTTITKPKLFRRYLSEQLSVLTAKYITNIEVTLSSQEIPFSYVLDDTDISSECLIQDDIKKYFSNTELIKIDDNTTDGLYKNNTYYPLSHFNALRIDFSLARIKHYTGTPVEHFQSYILFTNYIRYVDEFIRWSIDQIYSSNSLYISLSCAGGVLLNKNQDINMIQHQLSTISWNNHQMPAYHLINRHGQGITMINIGIGPSNAKTICDHIAVLRPHAWIMIGHCGGLRKTQNIGDYVLAHAYLRDDHVLDHVLPPDIPIPSIAEVQRALFSSIKKISGIPEEEIKLRLRTGTVVTTNDRNWELRYQASILRFNLSRAIAVDMESATIAAQGYRFRVPYGTLLCVSDKPLDGEIKLAKQASQFYLKSISEHLQIGIGAIDLLRKEGDNLHSRKLRSFNEPPFR